MLDRVDGEVRAILSACYHGRFAVPQRFRRRSRQRARRSIVVPQLTIAPGRPADTIGDGELLDRAHDDFARSRCGDRGRRRVSAGRLYESSQ